MLAFYLYPFEPKQKPREYTKEQLEDVQTVKELFDYCQILGAYITRSGWDFLVDYYGYEKLYEIDKKSGWHFDETDSDLNEYIDCVKYEMENAIEQ